MTMSNSLKLIKTASDRMVQRFKDDPEYARAFIRSVMGPPKRKLEGTEYKQVWLMLQLVDPVRETNNQHSWCVEYNVGGKMYDVIFFPNEEPIIEEYLDDA